ncbi:hypothetical protein HMPREF0682_1911 [Propionibacterium acidifaciens F0233]|uniref:Uncharacterized protein n=1 Tax=Propionibacterium acidifaciens F0233 TaxID=553198 RepID=U2QLX1_9ACTN|nr:hypothetical protein HMPREF0682_1911 [Propionibacterium acidifaciens F0233]
MLHAYPRTFEVDVHDLVKVLLGDIVKIALALPRHASIVEGTVDPPKCIHCR